MTHFEFDADNRENLKKFSVEVRAVFLRWEEESDLEAMDMAEAAAGVINNWLEEPVIDFESDMDLDLGDNKDGN